MTSIPPPVRECHEALILGFGDEIAAVAVPGGEKRIPKRRQFYPINSLRNIFGIEEIQKILDHKCENCPRHLPKNETAHPKHYSPDRILKTDAALSLFALLVSLRYPLLIGTFLMSYEDQALPLPRYFSEFDLQDRQFGHLPSRSREQLASAFQERKWRFSVPTFSDGSFQAYEEGIILPYLDEEIIGSGGSSKVFKVWVHPHYCTLTPSPVT
jgi:hypothetical protein